ncbi:MFS transporter [Leucobacter sp. HY1910]
MASNTQSVTARRVAFASLVGTSIEWYDYFLFGTAAVLVFNTQFFSSLNPTAGMLASLATFGVAFIARPFGGIIFGHFGDRIGRKSMLVLSLLMMGGGTIVIGLLPTYAQIGVWAPILLVAARVLQGFAVGGEWSGAVLMAAEHAPADKRAFYASWPQSGVPIGMALSTGAFFFIQLLPAEDVQAWAWRIPFLASGILVVLGLWIRLTVTESPEFAKIKASGSEAKLPVAEVMATSKKPLLLGIFVLFAPNIPFYIATVFLLTYVPENVGIGSSVVLLQLTVVSVLEAFTIPRAAQLADKIGRSKTLMIGAGMFIVLAFPMFLMINTGSAFWLFIALLLLLPVSHALSYAAAASYISDIFPARVRYTGTAMSYQLGSIASSAVAPLIAGGLLAATGSWVGVALYLALAGAITVTGLAVSGGDAALQHKGEDGRNSPGNRSGDTGPKDKVLVNR